jgi:hypothetical protein
MATRKRVEEEEKRLVEEELQLPPDLKEVDTALRMAVRQPKVRAKLKGMLKSLRRTGSPSG